MHMGASRQEHSNKCCVPLCAARTQHTLLCPLSTTQLSLQEEASAATLIPTTSCFTVCAGAAYRWRSAPPVGS